MTRRKCLTNTETHRLHADIWRRLELQHIMAENSMDVLEMEFGVTDSTIWRLDAGIADVDMTRKMKPEQSRELVRRRKLYHIARDEFADYTRLALQARYQVSRTTITRHIWQVRDEFNKARRMAA